MYLYFEADILKGVRLLEELFYSDTEVSPQECLLNLSIGTDDSLIDQEFD